MNSRLIVTTSWDDGHPADMKIAEALAKHGVAGTFYVPTRNTQGRPVLNTDEVARLSNAFEIGGHSTDHVVLTDLSDYDAQRQITDNRRFLEDTTGKPVHGFCYVRGRYTTQLKAIVKQAGFKYARTVANLYAANTDDPFEMPTTIQLYPHRKSVYLKGFARGRLESTRVRLLWAALASGDVVRRVERLIALCRRTGGYFHLWGHSWEIEELDLWHTLESILRRLAAESDSITFATNYEAHCAATHRGPGL